MIGNNACGSQLGGLGQDRGQRPRARGPDLSRRAADARRRRHRDWADPDALWTPAPAWPPMWPHVLELNEKLKQNLTSSSPAT
ncbi:hypothetical protein HBB16_06145 [Pseudonocardia sp. MCCB 268]|nr:hypothetical protein [Pseudonocardia cytotoxica]